MKARTRRGSLANHRLAPYVAFLGALGTMYLTYQWIGPIDLAKARRFEISQMFVLILAPFLAVTTLFDPLVRVLDRIVYPPLPAQPDDRSAEAIDRARADAKDRAARTRAARPFSSRPLAPFLYSAGVVATMLLLFALTASLDIRDQGARGWVIIAGTAVASIPAYDPISRFLDKSFAANVRGDSQ